jgi:excinuclease ABC subunit B
MSGAPPATRIAEPRTEYRALSPEAAMKHIKKLEEAMYRHARDLEFEQAAKLRDEIARIRSEAFGLPSRKVG